LGSAMTSLEAQLLIQWSEKIDVKVICPTDIFEKNKYQCLRPYRRLAERTQKIETLGNKSNLPTENEPAEDRSQDLYKRFPTMLAEVKDTVSQVRTWLERGVALQNILVVSPSIKQYEAVLTSYLVEEGIAFVSETKAPMLSFPEIQKWVSKLRFDADEVVFEDLETLAYSAQTKHPVLDYDEFKFIFGRIYGREDLRRDERIRKLYELDYSNQEIDRDQLLVWLIKRIDATLPIDRVTRILQRFLLNTPKGLLFSISDWISSLQSLISEMDDHSASENLNGQVIRCVDLHSAEYYFSTHRIFLGMSDQSLRTSVSVSIPQSDWQEVESTTGFIIPGSEVDRNEFEVHWLSKQMQGESCYFYSMTDFDGAPQAPSLFWLLGSGLSDKLEVAQFTRWDELQQLELSEIYKIRNWSSTRANSFVSQLEADLGLRKLSKIKSALPHIVSSSSLEDYAECPFIFAAKRLFQLVDQRELDLDLDPIEKGNLTHEFLRELTEEPIQFKRTVPELRKVVDSARLSRNMKMGDERFWPRMRERYVALAERFLRAEQLFRKEFPQSQIVGWELEIMGFMDLETGGLSSKKTPKSIQFAGRIDRLDGDQEGNYVVYDYKANTFDLKSPKLWIKQAQYQMALYTEALSQGLSEFGPINIVGAQYYSTKTLERVKGFAIQEESKNLFPTLTAREGSFSREEWVSFFAEMQLEFKKLLDRMVDGEIEPKPMNVKQCDNCMWRQTCRAPHLN
jgi:ATP-dependent helicase/nuclease subunit B